jgi:hypothetical protein
MVHAYREKNAKVLMADLRKAQRNGWIRKDIKPPFILFMLEKLNGFMLEDGFRSMYKNSHDAIMELTNFMFYGLFPSDGRGK